MVGGRSCGPRLIAVRFFHAGILPTPGPLSRLSIGTVEEGSVTTSLTVAEVADSQEQQQPQSKSNGAVSRRVAGQNVALSNGNSTSNVGRVTPRSHMEQEKRMRREIANSNERRRMQSINAGFQSLRTLLPHHEGEKLSKVSGDGLFSLRSLAVLSFAKSSLYRLLLVYCARTSTTRAEIWHEQREILIARNVRRNGVTRAARGSNLGPTRIASCAIDLARHPVKVFRSERNCIILQ
ncbi:Transcription factor AP-4 [Eufriesea mexicana]|uniref:Transcription factor AP-4 n=1 Tax=Eufriesea mexicana TaxID=516756 RepID=A0A310SGG5_9HYME|nr:Transcription factor AP-4 [Eufriesea mexicana]